MSESATTPYSNQCSILGDLWMTYRKDADFSDFIEYSDLGLPLAYAISNDVVKSTPMAQQFIEETFDLFLAGLEIQDEGFETLEDILERP